MVGWLRSGWLAVVCVCVVAVENVFNELAVCAPWRLWLAVSSLGQHIFFWCVCVASFLFVYVCVVHLLHRCALRGVDQVLML